MHTQPMKVLKEPYRLFFPLGVALLLWGALIWIPLLWNAGDYPVLAHRYLMLNGFVGCFIGGFLMTAVPKFSKTVSAHKYEVVFYLIATLSGIVPAYAEKPELVFLCSALQPYVLLIFLFTRILKRKENPPYSFVFIFVGLFLWFFSGLAGIFSESEMIKQLHYEGAIAAIILGVGSRLIPGILGHEEIVRAQREKYENVLPVLQTIPKSYLILMGTFVGSYFLPQVAGGIIRAIDVILVGVFYWRLWKLPAKKSSLSWSVWIASWCILTSFIFKAIAQEGLIHISHSFFISGIVLLCLLVGTRVLQSHGPKDATLEESKILYLVTFLLIFTASTRVSAYLIPELYLSHLGYSSLLLSTAAIVWSFKYLRYANT